MWVYIYIFNVYNINNIYIKWKYFPFTDIQSDELKIAWGYGIK